MFRSCFMPAQHGCTIYVWERRVHPPTTGAFLGPGVMFVKSSPSKDSKLENEIADDVFVVFVAV